MADLGDRRGFGRRDVVSRFHPLAADVFAGAVVARLFAGRALYACGRRASADEFAGAAFCRRADDFADVGGAAFFAAVFFGDVRRKHRQQFFGRRSGGGNQRGADGRFFVRAVSPWPRADAAAVAARCFETAPVSAVEGGGVFGRAGYCRDCFRLAVFRALGALVRLRHRLIVWPIAFPAYSPINFLRFWRGGKLRVKIFFKQPGDGLAAISVKIAAWQKTGFCGRAFGRRRR